MKFIIGNRYALREDSPVEEMNFLKEPRKLIEIKNSKDEKYLKLLFEGKNKFLNWKFCKDVNKSSLKHIYVLFQEELDV